MPSKLRSGGTYPYILEDDRNDCSSPQFMLRVLSYEESLQLSDYRQAFIEEKDERKRAAIVQSMLPIAMASCCIPGYEQSDMRELLSAIELWELINAATEGASLTAEERKKFVLPASCDGEKSAEGVATENASSS